MSIEDKREDVYTRDVNIQREKAKDRKVFSWKLFWQVSIILAAAVVCVFVVYSISLAKELL